MTADRRDESERNGMLPARQERVAACLAAGKTVARAARECHVGRTTIWMWLRQPVFRARVDELRDLLTERTLGLLAAASADAVLTLAELLGAQFESTRSAAADKILSHSVKHREAHDLQKQLASIQEQLSSLEAARRKPR